MSTQDEQRSRQHQSLENALENLIQRLDRRIENLILLNRRYSWYRLGVLLVGSTATWITAVTSTANLTRLVLLVALAAFFLVVYFHRRLDLGIARFSIWRNWRLSQLARVRLDWASIPYLPPATATTRRGLQTDLDLIGLQSLHHLLDLAVSVEGSQLLADWLSQSQPDNHQIGFRQQVVRELKAMPRFTDRLLLNSRLVSTVQLRGQNLLRWLQVETPSNRLKWSLLGAAFLVALNLSLFVLSSAWVLPPYWILTTVLYLGYYFYSTGGISKFLDAIVELDRELDKLRVLVEYLENYPMHGSKHLENLCAPFRQEVNPPSVLLRKIKIVTAGVGLRMNPVLSLLLNIVLPWDFTFAFFAGLLSKQAAQYLPAWLDTWRKLEALCSLANFAALNPEYCFPEIVSSGKPVFKAVRLGHPLIPASRKVSNDFYIPKLGSIAIITGSNMAGKSTFIKTVGINLCLAYAGGPVSAVTFCALPFRLHTCIQISDSIVDGFSYFYAEVKCLKALLDKLNQLDQPPVLYLIDEIFRGTNNRERLIGSKAYTRALLGGNGVGMIATHDLELAQLSDHNPLVHNFHFRDHIVDDRLAFDYSIRDGPCPTTNALMIMRMEGLPFESDSMNS